MNRKLSSNDDGTPVWEVVDAKRSNETWVMNNVFLVWQCQLCSFVYDEAQGLLSEGFPPGTRWSDIPESWSCPDCGYAKADFQMVEI